MVRALLLIMVAASPVAAKEVVTSTGKLDFELVDRGDSFVLRSPAYAITFPSKPTLQTMPFDVGDEKGEGLSALVSNSTGSYGIVIRPMPKHWQIAPKQQFANLRDGFLKGAGAKPGSETAIKLAGIEGRRVTATGSENGKPLYLTLDILWDRDHRVDVAVMSIETKPQRSAMARAFVDSLAITKAAQGPLDEAVPAEGVAIKSNVAGLELVRRGSTYVVRNDAVEIQFPLHPVFRTLMTTPVTIGAAIGVSGDMESFALAVVVVPAKDAYDPEKGIDGTRDGMLKLFANEKHTETKLKLGALAGRHIEATGMKYGVPARIEIYSAWDPDRRMLVTATAETSAKQMPADARAFLKSLTFSRSHK